MKKRIVLVLLALALLPVMAFAKAAPEEPKEEGPFKVVVFVPGVVAGSPPYEKMVAGAEAAVAENPNVEIKVFEAGFNQGEWEEKITSLIATGEYDLFLSTNPAIPALCYSAAESFPKQKFAITDAYDTSQPNMATYLYNQYEQSYLLGYLAGLVTTSDMEFANPDKKIGFVLSQEYPLITRMVQPGLLDGARAVDPAITLDTRIVGNWYDANKGAELAGSMIDAGVDVLACIAGGAGQGVFTTVAERGGYIVYHDSDAYEAAPGSVIACGLMGQEKLIREIVLNAAEGTLEYGKAEILGMEEGYVEIITESPRFQALPDEIKAPFTTLYEQIKSGELDLGTPGY